MYIDAWKIALLIVCSAMFGGAVGVIVMALTAIAGDKKQ